MTRGTPRSFSPDSTSIRACWSVTTGQWPNLLLNLATRIENGRGHVEALLLRLRPASLFARSLRKPALGMADQKPLPILGIAADHDRGRGVAGEGNVEPDQPARSLLGAQLVVATDHRGDRILLEEGSAASGRELGQVLAPKCALTEEQPLLLQEDIGDRGVQLLRRSSERDRPRQPPCLRLREQPPVEVVAIGRRRDPERPPLLPVDRQQRPSGLPDPLQRSRSPALADEMSSPRRTRAPTPRRRE